MTMRTKTDADAVALEAVVESAPRLLLRIPGIRQSWQHIDCDGFGEAPPVPFMRRTTTGADNGEVGEWAEWSLGFTVAGDPVALPFGDPTASYQAIVDKGWTYQQLLDWKSAGATTYVQVLRGGF
ncbi:MAG: hypothetical protein IPL80_19955 [Sterolibacteriaceae bacterium]|nr:hypothetical protein [Sterolibacteriaceae bacterium]